MKKSILFIAVAVFMFLGNQAVDAQAKIKNNTQTQVSETVQATAKTKTTKLVRALELSSKQQEQVYNLFLKSEEKLSKASSEIEGKELNAKQAKMDKYVEAKMKEILKEEQYKKYLNLAKDL
ncbi:hypothetical protein AB9K26_04480 [Psychroserpens sp. XS_ASV72]|uniref:hypothetical protein n=1 Tax=Psychroserpens sp. XS_ASV72 TaxID=3241293 RepID=UPI003514D09A